MRQEQKQLKLIGYCRTSTKNQMEKGTINHQVKDLKKFAKLQKIELVKIFEDSGVSGSLEWHDRKGMSEMFDYLKDNKNINGVLIFKLDRLARDLRIQENIIYDLQERQEKKIISIKEPDLDSKDITRVLFRQMLSAVAQYEKGVIVMRMANGRIKKAERGEYAGGCPAMGYKNKDNQLVISKKEAETVKRIFIMRRNRHLGFSEIARQLNAERVKTARGGSWYASTIKYILLNKKYSGYNTYKSIKVTNKTLALI